MLLAICFVVLALICSVFGQIDQSQRIKYEEKRARINHKIYSEQNKKE